jgi:hypothetical protein
MKTIFLTLCYYEHPVAQAHIDFWENSMKEKIVSKISTEGFDPKESKIEVFNSLFYVVKKNNDDLEIVYCIRIQNIPKLSFLLKDILAFEKSHKTSYLKTLVFGKLEAEDFQKIIKFTNEVEDLFNHKTNL